MGRLEHEHGVCERMQCHRDGEEVSLLFGTNQTLYTGQKEVTVKVTNRIVLSPYAAKRLQVLLGEVIKQYESKFGALEIGVK